MTALEVPVERLTKLVAMHGDDADADTLRALLVERDALRARLDLIETCNGELQSIQLLHEMALAIARREGAEAMRERAAQQCCERLQANIIRALPLPGDEP
jgi:hypothetical protein